MSKAPEKAAFFSIITVTLNNIAGLKTTHKSLQDQNCDDFEWIVIDGASTDETPQYLKTTDAKWASRPDCGIYDAMNKGVERASGKYLLFLNAGDALAAPETLQNIKKAAHNHPDFIYGDSLEDGAYKPARTADLRSGTFTHHQAMLYNRKALGDMRYDLRYKIAADYDLSARFLKDHGNILYCPFPICIFESGGVSQTNAVLGRREQYQIRKDLQLTGPVQNRIITSAQAALWTLRRVVPSLYWHLKSSDNNAPATARNDTPPPHPENQA